MASLLNSLRSSVGRSMVYGRQPTPAPKPYQEMGVSGTAVWGGYVQVKERSPEWLGRQKWITASELAVNTSIVAAGVHYFLNLVAYPKWTFSPHDDGDEESLALAEFAEHVLNNMNTPFYKVIRRAAMYRFHGFGVQEWTAKHRDDGLIGFKDIEARPQHTIEQWDVDVDGTVLGVWQRSPQTGHMLGLPRDKLLYLVEDTLTDNPEGLGMFRHMADPYKRLKQLQELEIRAYERDLRGIPIARAPLTFINRAVEQGVITDAQAKKVISDMQAMVQLQVKQSDTGLVLDSLPYFSDSDAGDQVSAIPQWGFELLNGAGVGHGEIAAAIDRVQREIARIIGVEHLMMGDAGGNRALSEDKSRNLYLVANSVLKYIASMVKSDILVPLWRLNGFPMDKMPEPKPEDVTFKNAEAITNALGKMASAGAPLAPNDPVINDVRELMGVAPVPDELMQAAAAQPMNPALAGLPPELQALMGGKPGAPGAGGPGGPKPNPFGPAGGPQGGGAPSNKKPPFGKGRPDQARGEDGRWVDEGGSSERSGRRVIPWSREGGTPPRGEPFIVYRLGTPAEPLENRNAGNAQGVAYHLARMDDATMPGQAIGNTITAYRVVVNGPYSKYTPLTQNKPDVPGARLDDGVGFAHARGNSVFSFPKGADWTAEPVASVPLSTVRNALKQAGYSDFDDSGSITGGYIIHEIFANRGAHDDASVIDILRPVGKKVDPREEQPQPDGIEGKDLLTELKPNASGKVEVDQALLVRLLERLAGDSPREADAGQRSSGDQAADEGRPADAKPAPAPSKPSASPAPASRVGRPEPAAGKKPGAAAPLGDPARPPAGKPIGDEAAKPAAAADVRPAANADQPGKPGDKPAVEAKEGKPDKGAKPVGGADAAAGQDQQQPPVAGAQPAIDPATGQPVPPGQAPQPQEEMTPEKAAEILQPYAEGNPTQDKETTESDGLWVRLGDEKDVQAAVSDGDPMDVLDGQDEPFARSGDRFGLDNKPSLDGGKPLPNGEIGTPIGGEPPLDETGPAPAAEGEPADDADARAQLARMMEGEPVDEDQADADQDGDPPGSVGQGSERPEPAAGAPSNSDPAQVPSRAKRPPSARLARPGKPSAAARPEPSERVRAGPNPRQAPRGRVVNQPEEPEPKPPRRKRIKL